MRYFLIAGEASGDLQGADLMAGLRKKDPYAVFRYFGGDYMQEQGGALIKHYKELDFMGFKEVVANLNQVFNNLRDCKREILHFKPDVVILIDYPGFNLRIAKYAKKKGFRVNYYISPKIWAWKESRIKKIKKYVDRMFVILPFEVDYYQKFNFPVTYEGHPHIDMIRRRVMSNKELTDFREANNISEQPVIALLPGSRKQELDKVLPVMMSVVDQYPDHQFLIAATSHISMDYYRELTPDHERVKIIPGKTYEILQIAKAALVTSGTATLETALFGVPQVVCYKTSPLSYQIGKLLIDISFISLVNLIMEKEVVKEFIQNDLNPNRLKNELDALLYDEDYKNQILKLYQELRNKLGQGDAPERIAGHIYADLENSNEKARL